MIYDIILIILPVFMVIGLGFALKRTGLVTATFLFDLNRLIYFVALPALLFYKIATADFSTSFNGMLVLGLCLSILVTVLIAFAYGLVMGYKPQMLGAFCQGSFRGNLAYIGLAVAYNAYGEKGLAIAGILTGFLVPVMNMLAVVVLVLPQRAAKEGVGFVAMVVKVAANPLIIASFAGIAWSYFHLPLPLVLDRTLNIVTGMSLPMALIAIGASFSFQKLRGELGPAMIAAVFKIAGLPVLTAFLLMYLGVGGEELAVGVILAGSPTATAAYIMAQQMDSDAELSGAIIMLTTLLSIISYGVALYLLRS